MSEARALAIIWERSDAGWFADHPDRQAHIRNAYETECRGEFWSLGEHAKDRRRILLWKVPRDNPFHSGDRLHIMKVPFLAFADETIEDTDDILLPILHEIMKDGAKKYGRSG